MIAPTFVLLGLAALGFSAPTSPTFSYLYSINLTTTAPVDIGVAPFGDRGILTITGGTFAGPKLNGTVVTGLDWGLTDAKGTFSPDAVYVLKTADGAAIYVSEKGHAPNVHILFETGSESYSWLNTVVGYATGAPITGGVALDVWQIGA